MDKRHFFIFLFLLISIHLIGIQKKATLELDKTSVISIHGTTNLVPFTLEQHGDKLVNTPLYILATINENKLFIKRNSLTVRVRDFKSKDLMAEHAFYKLMESDRYPSLNISLSNFETEIGNQKEHSSSEATVRITITGVTKQYTIPVSTNIQGNTVELLGKMKMNIRDFGLKPPIEMMGLIKVNEWIEIEFSFNGQLKTKSAI